MLWVSILVVTLIVGYIVSETIGDKFIEGFSVNRRTDIGPVSEGWTHDESGWVRDLRYTETFTNVQGLEIAGDFCRAVHKYNKPDTLQIACALATREGSNTLEYHSKTVAEGFRMSRDDYWKAVTKSGRSDYCRILKDDVGWFAGCAVTTESGIGPREVRDTNPPPYIKNLLEAYDGCMAWYRWQDDAVDITGQTVTESKGSPVFPSLLKPLKTRGLEVSPTNYLRWGEPETLMLDQDIPPNQIRTLMFWVWFDSFGTVLDMSNSGKDRVWIGVEDDKEIPPAPLNISQAIEVRPDHYLVQKPLVENKNSVQEKTSAYIFEIWDEEQRILELSGLGARKEKWQHVTVTTLDKDAWHSAWSIWIDGVQVDKKEGRTIPALTLTTNLIGLFKGFLQDFRVYNRPVTEAQIKSAMAWSGPTLHPNP